jgi:hypothetical protein
MFEETGQDAILDEVCHASQHSSPGSLKNFFIAFNLHFQPSLTPPGSQLAWIESQFFERAFTSEFAEYHRKRRDPSRQRRKCRSRRTGHSFSGHGSG